MNTENALTPNAPHDHEAHVVQRYLVAETKELIYDGEKLEKWREACRQLGLKGQAKLTGNQPEGKSPIPFMFMKKAMADAFVVLCPRKVKAVDYDLQPIPLEVLDLIGLAMREGYFQKIEIWYDDEKPDPICVGTTCSFIPMAEGWNSHPEGRQTTREACKQWLRDNGFKPYSENDYCREDNVAQYLMARWGDMRKTLDQLVAEAKQRYKHQQRTNKQLEINRLQRELEDIDLEAERKFGRTAATGEPNEEVF
jgi:hypothetical protein